MTARTFIYGKLLQIPSISDLGGLEDPRIFAKKTMTSADEQHPFLVYKLGVDATLLKRLLYFLHDAHTLVECGFVLVPVFYQEEKEN